MVQQNTINSEKRQPQPPETPENSQKKHVKPRHEKGLNCKTYTPHFDNTRLTKYAKQPFFKVRSKKHPILNNTLI